MFNMEGRGGCWLPGTMENKENVVPYTDLNKIKGNLNQKEVKMLAYSDFFHLWAKLHQNFRSLQRGEKNNHRKEISGVKLAI